jgi:hypothetical protein
VGRCLELWWQTSRLSSWQAQKLGNMVILYSTCEVFGFPSLNKQRAKQGSTKNSRDLR